MLGDSKPSPSTANAMRFTNSTLLALLFATLFSPVLMAGSDKPNFVFILVDDLGKEDLGVEGSQFYETPHIDGLANRSLRFERGYSACQVCSPSRAAIQTGKTPARVSVTDYISHVGRNQPEQWNRNTKLLPAKYQQHLNLDEVTIAEALQSNGYKTFFAGKWHLGGDGHTPEDQGYEVNQGGYHFGTPPGGYHSPYRNPKLSDDEAGAELPIRLGNETAKFIRDKSKTDAPFFAMLSFYSVHGPIQCSQNRFAKFQAKAEDLGLTNRAEPRFALDRVQEVRQVQDHPVYAGMMAALDDSVGLVLDAIKDSGIADNTIVIFTSDNGGVSSGDGYATSCLPMRGGKGRQWEGGIRQPYYIHWPNVTKGGTTDVLATGMDFYPTILEIAGLPSQPKQHIDGVSLVPALKGESLPKRSLYWHYPHYGNQGGEPSAITMDDRWKLIHYFEDSRNELYDVTKDIGEQNNVAATHPEVVDSMLKSLQQWQTEVGATMPSVNEKFSEEQFSRSMATKKNRSMPAREKQHAGFMKSDFLPKGGWWNLRKPPRIKD